MSNTPSTLAVVAGWIGVTILSTAFITFAFATSEYVQSDIPGWQDGLLTSAFLFGFGVTALGWVGAIWLTARRYAI